MIEKIKLFLTTKKGKITIGVVSALLAFVLYKKFAKGGHAKKAFR